MRKHLKAFVFSLMVLGLIFGTASLAAADIIPIDSIDGDWANVVGGQNVSISNDLAPNGRLSTASWGSQTARSSYDFLSTSTPFNADSIGTAFALGQFTHNNFPIPSGSGISSIDLLFNLGIDALPLIPATFIFKHTETPNSCVGANCANDLVEMNPVLNADFIYNAKQYYFSMMGFSTDGGNTIKTDFSTIENLSNSAFLYGQITEVPVSTPEPLTLLLLGLGLVGIAGLRKRS